MAELKKKQTYKDAGVDIKAGENAVEAIRELVRSTYIPGVIGDIGAFAGLFSLEKLNYRNPVLVASCDGVGTKLRIAQIFNCHNTIGIDLVAMCVNDIIVMGAKPLFLLDYIATSKLSPPMVVEIIKGIVEGCKQAECALIGGEMAEMPGFYPRPDEYDVAGFVVGVVEKDEIIDGSKVKEGDAIIGVASSGLHSNGFSLVRKVLLEDENEVRLFNQKLGCILGEALLCPTKIYVKTFFHIKNSVPIKAAAHITGGGITGNLPRVLPSGTSALIKRNSWQIHPIFSLIQEEGNIETDEMYRTFNMGIGLILVIAEEDVRKALILLSEKGEEAYLIGRIIKGERGVIYE